MKSKNVMFTVSLIQTFRVIHDSQTFVNFVFRFYSVWGNCRNPSGTHWEGVITSRRLRIWNWLWRLSRCWAWSGRKWRRFRNDTWTVSKNLSLPVRRCEGQQINFLVLDLVFVVLQSWRRFCVTSTLLDYLFPSRTGGGHAGWTHQSSARTHKNFWGNR